MTRWRELTLGVATAIYIAVTWRIFHTHAGHPDLIALALQHLILLPTVIWLLRSTPGSTAGFRPAALLVLYLAGALLIGWWRGQGGAIQADESAWAFQSRIFAAGELTTDAPTPTSSDPAVSRRELFFEWNLIHGDRWGTLYAPGWPAVLALGQLVHGGWIVNPLLGVLLLVLTYRLGLQLFDQPTARIAVVLCVLSPYFLFDCVGYLSHTLCAILVSAAMLFCFRGIATRRLADFAVMLALVIAACMTRPATGAAAGLVVTGGALWSLRADRRHLARFLAIALGAGVVALVVWTGYNHAITGAYWTSPYVLFSQLNSYQLLTFNPRELIARGLLVYARWSMEGTAMYVVPFFFLLVGWAAFKEFRRLEIVLPALMFLSLVGIYLIVPLPSASTWGERYYFEAFAGMAVLAARGWVLLQRRMPGILTVALVSVQAVHFALFVPAMMALIRPYVTMQAFAKHLPYTQTMVFLADSPYFTAKHFNVNAVDWKHAPILFLVDPGPDRRQAVACIEQRSHWTVLTYDAAADSGRLTPLQDTGTCDR